MAFTTIDKNLLIAALESALLYAQQSAGVASLEDLTTQVSGLREAFDINPDSVTDAMLEGMIATLQAVDIPDPAQLSRLLTASNVTNTSTYIAVCSWATLLNKPATFPPSVHAHAWNEVTYKPATFPPATHTHPVPNPFPVGRFNLHSLPDVPNLVQERDGSAQYEELATLANIDAKIATHQATHSVAWGQVSAKPTTFPADWHEHSYADIQQREMIGDETMRNYLLGAIQMFPANMPSGYYLPGWENCDGGTIPRTSPLGYAFEEAGFPFGTGDGSTTCNKPTVTAAAGFVYKIFVGAY